MTYDARGGDNRFNDDQRIDFCASRLLVSLDDRSHLESSLTRAFSNWIESSLPEAGEGSWALARATRLVDRFKDTSSKEVGIFRSAYKKYLFSEIRATCIRWRRQGFQH